MPLTKLELSLSRAELSVEVVSRSLVQGRPEEVESAARALNEAAVNLLTALQGSKGQAGGDCDLKQRVAAVAQRLAMQREACTRRQAVVERSLHSILPGARASTYGGAAVRYTSNARQSGAFKLLSA